MYGYWIKSLFAPSLTATALIFLAMVLWGRISRKETLRDINWARAALTAVLFGYLVGLFSITLDIPVLLAQGMRYDGDYNLVPLRQIRGFLNHMQSVHTNVNLWGNILVFIPIGFLIPLLWDMKRPLLGGTLWATGISLFIELFQIVTPRISDVDDVILNTLGGLLGAAGYLLFRRLWPRAARRPKAGGASSAEDAAA